MTNNHEQSFVPKLRFPEFEDGGEWEVKSLGEIGEPLMCKRIFKEETNSDPKDGIPFYKIGTFGRLADSYISKELYTEYRSKYSFPNIGDILISASGTIGRLVIYDGSPAYFQDSNIIWLGHNEGIVLNSFLFYCYSNLRWQTSDGGVISRLYNSDFKRMIIGFPKNQKEQEKIAACLSSLDDLISAENHKLDALTAHKKGLLQHLFPTEGETVPNLRFPEFEDSGEWSFDKLEDHIDLFSGIALKSEEMSDDESGIPILRGINITEGYIRHSKDIDKYFLGDLENLKRYLIKENDIVIGMDGSKVGKNVALVKREDENSILIQRVARIRANQKSDINYIYHHFISDKFRSYVDTVNTSSGIPHISAQQIKDFQLGFPPKLNEQEKIAACLSSLDDLISAQRRKVEALKVQKKGLMQGLFPSINEE